MKRVTTLLACAALLVFGAASAFASCDQTIGGHDETTESFAGANWAAAAVATPGTSPVIAGTHLYITEVGWRGLNSATLTDSTEFIEIYNPTTASIDLSCYYLSDVNAYSTLPVLGTIDLAANNTDFAMKFPSGSSIAAGAVKVIAIDGGRYRRGTGVNADYMFFNAGGSTTAVQMVDVKTNGGATYPGFGSFTNTAEFVWLFSWNGYDDLVCDVDLVTWGTGAGANLPALKTAAMCQDGPDPNVVTQCYKADLGPIGALTAPASGAGTRQRAAAEVETTPSGGGNGCVEGRPTSTKNATWGHVKTLYR
jgi:hypothetical protein